MIKGSVIFVMLIVSLNVIYLYIVTAIKITMLLYCALLGKKLMKVKKKMFILLFTSIKNITRMKWGIHLLHITYAITIIVRKLEITCIILIGSLNVIYFDVTIQ